MKSESAWVYLPDDEPDSTLRFAGQDYTLRPNAATEIVPHSSDPLTIHQAAERGKVMAPAGIPPHVVAAHFVSTHGRWGVVVVSGPVRAGENGKGLASTPADQDLVDAAEKVYFANTRTWAEELVLERAARNKPRTESGLAALPPTEDEQKAETWLRKHKFLA